ncbi:MAG: urease accessory protein [Candidatus Binatia bacterium]
MIASMLIFGFLLGVRHSLEADHVAAVAALSTRASSRQGLLRLAAGWGVGHSLTILVVGSAVIALGITLPLGSEAVLDRVVGLVLMGMGIDVVRRALARHVHLHVHEHGDGERHLHLHAHDEQVAHAAHHSVDHGHQHFPLGTGRALAMGTLHGVAGSAALLLLVVPQAESGLAAVACLATFGAGSIAGMMLFSLALSFPLRMATRLAGATSCLEGALGIATLMVGVRILAF